MPRVSPGCLISLVVALASPARAAPAIDADRPGLLFAGTTIAPGHLEFELGLPDGSVSSSADQEMLDAVLRVGVLRHLEIQVGGPIVNRLRTEGAGAAAFGAGDLLVGLKASASGWLGDGSTTTVVGYASLPTGTRTFTSGGFGAQLYAQSLWEITDRQSVGAQLSLGYSPGTTTGQLAAAWSVQLAAALNGYVEAAFGHPLSGLGGTALVGAGLAWVPTPRVQLDVSADRGLTSRSPNWLFGWGVSVLI